MPEHKFSGYNFFNRQRINMKIALFLTLVLISGSCSQYINEFASRLCFGFCGPAKMRPTWLFESKWIYPLLFIAIHQNTI